MPKSVAAMGDELVGLFEGAFVEQELDALAGRHLAGFVLPFAALWPPPSSASRIAAFSVRLSFCPRSMRGDYSGSRAEL